MMMMLVVMMMKVVVVMKVVMMMVANPSPGPIYACIYKHICTVYIITMGLLLFIC